MDLGAALDRDRISGEQMLWMIAAAFPAGGFSESKK